MSYRAVVNMGPSGSSLTLHQGLRRITQHLPVSGKGETLLEKERKTHTYKKRHEDKGWESLTLSHALEKSVGDRVLLGHSVSLVPVKGLLPSLRISLL